MTKAKPCGCAKADAFDCAIDLAAHGIRFTPREEDHLPCACVCHDEHTRRANRLRLLPEKQKANLS